MHIYTPQIVSTATLAVEITLADVELREARYDLEQRTLELTLAEQSHWGLGPDGQRPITSRQLAQFKRRKFEAMDRVAVAEDLLWRLPTLD